MTGDVFRRGKKSCVRAPEQPRIRRTRISTRVPVCDGLSEFLGSTKVERLHGVAKAAPALPLTPDDRGEMEKNRADLDKFTI